MAGGSLSSVAAGFVDNQPESPVHPGQVLEGKFRVERVIGEGAMGLVVEAMHLDLDERVALKFLHREARERPDIVTRFAREARAAAKIQSDHVARVYDVGGTSEGSPFIVMELLEGKDLESVVTSQGPLPIAEAALHVIQACEGLTAAHVLGIVHRDIKPANLFRVERAGGRDIKLLDFGISKAAITGSGTFDDIDVASADTTQIMGSPHYMSPEQIRSTKDVDARADLWSLGVVLFELLTAGTPFTATDVTGIIAQVLHEPHRSVRTLRPDVPPELGAIIDRCLQKDPDKRFHTAADLAVALLPFAPKRARPVVERATAMMTRASGQAATVDSLPPPPLSAPSLGGPTSNAAPAATVPAIPKRPFMWLALACIILGIAGGLLAFSSRRRPSPRPDPTALQPALTAATIAIPSAESSSASTATVSATATTMQGASATPSTSAAASPTAQIAKPVRPTQRPAGKSPTSEPSRPSAPPSAETDIRRER